MPRDINGVYTLPGSNPVVPGTVIATGWANGTLDDIATALTNSLSVDGSVSTAKIANNAVTLQKLNAIVHNAIADDNFCTVTGTDSLTASSVNGFSPLSGTTNGLRLQFYAVGANATASVTLAYASVTRSVYTRTGIPCPIGFFQTGILYTLIYDSANTRWVAFHEPIRSTIGSLTTYRLDDGTQIVYGTLTMASGNVNIGFPTFSVAPSITVSADSGGNPKLARVGSITTTQANFVLQDLGSSGAYNPTYVAGTIQVHMMGRWF